MTPPISAETARMAPTEYDMPPPILAETARMTPTESDMPPPILAETARRAPTESDMMPPPPPKRRKLEAVAVSKSTRPKRSTALDAPRYTTTLPELDVIVGPVTQPSQSTSVSMASDPDYEQTLVISSSDDEDTGSSDIEDVIVVARPGFPEPQQTTSRPCDEAIELAFIDPSFREQLALWVHRTFVFPYTNIHPWTAAENSPFCGRHGRTSLTGLDNCLIFAGARVKRASVSCPIHRVSENWRIPVSLAIELGTFTIPPGMVRRIVRRGKLPRVSSNPCYSLTFRVRDRMLPPMSSCDVCAASPPNMGDPCPEHGEDAMQCVS